MTINECLMKIKEDLEAYQSVNAKYNSEIRRIDSEYKTRMSQIAHNCEKNLQGLKNTEESVDVYYRIAQTNTTKQVKTAVPDSNIDLNLLDNMVRKINSSQRNDPWAAQTIELISRYKSAFRDKEQIIKEKQNRDIKASEEWRKKEKERITNQTNCQREQYKHSLIMSMQKYSDWIGRLQGYYIISRARLQKWQFGSSKTNRILLGYKYLPIKMPQELEKNVHNMAAYSGVYSAIRVPIALTIGGCAGLCIEYSNQNEKQVYSFAQTLLLNLLSVFGKNVGINIFDDRYYNSDFLDALSVLTSSNSCIAKNVARDEKDYKTKLGLYKKQCKDLEDKLGTKSLHEYNAGVQKKLPYSILFINTVSSRDDHMSEWTTIFNNAKKLGIVIVCLKYVDTNSKDTYEKNKTKRSTKDILYLNMDDKGNWFMINQKEEKYNVGLLETTEKFDSSFVNGLENAVRGQEASTKFGDHFKPRIIGKNSGKRRPIRLPFGVDEQGGLVWADLSGMNFSGYVMGSAGSGKTSLLHTLIAGVECLYHPDEVELWLADFNKVEFAQYGSNPSPHMKYVLLDGSNQMVYDLVNKMEKILLNRQRLFMAKGWQSINDVPVEYYMPHVLFIIDEFAVMSNVLAETKGENVDYVSKFDLVFQIGRKFGVHVILASQSYTKSTRGLSEFAKQQLGTRFAMLNSDRTEIKETLSLPNYTDETKLLIARLQQWQTLYKYKNERTKDIEVKLVCNLYMDGDNAVLDVCSQTNKLYTAVDARNSFEEVRSNAGSNLGFLYKCSCSDNEYLRKKCIVKAGDAEKFASRANERKKYEKKQKDDLKLFDGDLTVYPGSNIGFESVKCFPLRDNRRENILCVGSNTRMLMNIILAIHASASNKGYKTEIWTNKYNILYQNLRRANLLDGLDVYTDEIDILDRYKFVNECTANKVENKEIVICLDYEEWREDIEKAKNGSSNVGNVPMANSVPKPVLPKDIMNMGPEEKKKAIEKYNTEVAAYNAARSGASVSTKSIDVIGMSELLDVVSQKTTAHFLFAFNDYNSFKSSGLKQESFNHKIFAGEGKSDALEFGVRPPMGIDRETSFYYCSTSEVNAYHPFMF